MNDGSISKIPTADAGVTATPQLAQRRSMLFPWLVLAIALPALFWLFGLLHDAVDRVAQSRFERQASEITHAIETRIQSYAEILYGLQALFSDQQPITRLQFHRYVTSLDLMNRYPGYDVVNYANFVTHAERARFEESVRRDTSLEPNGYPNFAIRPAGERAEYFVIVYVEPMAGFEFAFGLDLAANPAVTGADSKALTALQYQARDSGELTASGRPIRIKSRGRTYTGLAIRLAVYRGHVLPHSVEERRAAYLGSVGAGFNVEKVMQDVTTSEAARRIRFRVYDIGPARPGAEKFPANPESLLFDSASAAPEMAEAPSRTGSAKFISVQPIEFGGRNWEVHFSAPKSAIIDPIDTLLPWIVLTGGVLLSVLLAGMFYSLSSSRGRALAIAQEITKDLRASEKELRASTEQLQALSHRLVELQESERRQLARELHDRVGQNLTALSISLDILKSQHASTDAGAARARIDDAAALLHSTADVIENVMAELRPPMLDDYGLAPALEWYANQFSLRTSIEVSVAIEGERQRFAPTVEIALFRIVQEALNNVAKHAHATSATITLRQSQSHLVLAVTDNGAGYDSTVNPNLRRRPGLGMVTMRERAEAIGGTFDIHAAPGRGTTVQVCVPC